MVLRGWIFVLSALLPSLLFAQLSGTRTVCAAGCDYTTLTAAGGAFAAINSVGLNGNLTLEIRGNLTETGANVLNQWTETPANSNYSLTIRPQNNTMRTIAINSGNDLIQLNGADRVIIDGRDPGDASLSLTNRYLTFRNTGTGVTIRLTGDASSNTIRSCFVEGRVQSNTAGVITLDAPTTSGNDNNLFDYLDIKESTGNPRIGFYSAGAGSVITDNGTISNSRIYNFFQNNQDPRGIFLSTANDLWNISSNSLYQTANRTFTVNRTFRFISISSTAGSVTIQNNFIGGTAEGATGATWILSNSGANAWSRTRIVHIEGASSATATSISGNVIRLIEARSTQSVGAGEGVTVGLLIGSGQVNCINNVIGDNTGGLSHQTTGAQPGSANTFGISYEGGTFGEILNNRIDNLTINNSSTSVSSANSTVAGIYVTKSSGTETIRIERNVVGNRDGVTRITTNDNAVGRNLNAYGIYLAPSSSASTINVIRNYVGFLSSQASGTGSVASGIYFNSLSGLTNVTLRGNVVRDIVSSANNPGGGASGITMALPSATCVIEQNTISGIHNPNNIEVFGIYLGNLSAGATVANNMISLGSSQTSNTIYKGIFSATTVTGPINIYFNSVVTTGPGNAGNTSNTYALQRPAGNTSPMNLRNNIFMNTRGGGGSHYAIGIALSNSFDSDYNDLYATTAANTTLWLGSNYNFANWQIQSGQDANSLNYDATADFQNIPEGNLRIFYDGTINVLEDAGTAAGGITEDVDGARRILVPDIGACELYNGWIGVTNTDWNTLSNWTYLVPTCSDAQSLQVKVLDPEILPGNFRPFIGAFTGYFETLVIGLNASINLSDNSSILEQCTGSAAPDLLLVEGDLLITNGVTATTGQVRLLGDLENNGSITPGLGTFALQSPVNQTILGTFASNFYNLSLSGGGTKTLQQNITISNQLNFSSGNLITTSSALPTLGTSASTSGANNNSFVLGPIAKTFNSTTPFEFPVGKNNALRPATVTPSNTTTTTFTTEYFNTSARTAIGNVLDVDVDHVSDIEYWQISRSGSAFATVSLTWNLASAVDANAGSPGRDDLIVTQWDGSMWINRGGNSITGNVVAGSVTSDIVNSFNPPFTLGSSSVANPLPVTLLSFQAVPYGNKVRLTWETATELHNNYFTVEHATDGTEFRSIGQVKSKGDSRHVQSYEMFDNSPQEGVNYYRLRQTDYDGTTKVYKVVKVEFSYYHGNALLVYPNPVRASVVHILNSDIRSEDQVALLDIHGRIVHKFLVGVQGGEVSLQLPSGLSKGIYLLQVGEKHVRIVVE